MECEQHEKERQAPGTFFNVYVHRYYLCAVMQSRFRAFLRAASITVNGWIEWSKSAMINQPQGEMVTWNVGSFVNKKIRIGHQKLLKKLKVLDLWYIESLLQRKTLFK